MRPPTRWSRTCRPTPAGMPTTTTARRSRLPAMAGSLPTSIPTSSPRIGPPTRPWWIGSRPPSRPPPTRKSDYLAGNAYPVGTPANLRWWGSNTAQGQYAYPCLLYWSLTKEQKYIDAVSQLMDYAQGLNPIGKCYMTGHRIQSRPQSPRPRIGLYQAAGMGSSSGDSGLRSRRNRQRRVGSRRHRTRPRTQVY